jgi:predicted DNA binding CopG/RHH family protein
MSDLDQDELELLGAFDKDQLKSVATKSELAKLTAAARATASKDKHVNLRLSSGNLSDLQVRALQEGMPYQTLIASVVHKYVTGRFFENMKVAAKAAVKPAWQARHAIDKRTMSPHDSATGPMNNRLLQGLGAWQCGRAAS